MGSLTLRGLVLTLLAALAATGTAGARQAAPDRFAAERARFEPGAFAPKPLAEALGPDGTLRVKPGLRGVFDPTGFRLVSGPGEAPRFARAGEPTPEDESWSDIFSSPATDDVIRAVAVRGDEVFIGGHFAAVGKASANNVARWDGERWHSLGDGAENGVDGTVYSFAVAEDAVYVGGSFQRAGSVAASNIARWDAEGWSALGTPEANGVAGFGQIVYAIAVDGGRVLVGGFFTEAGGVPASSLAVFDRTTNAWAEFGGVRNVDPEDPAYVYEITLSKKDIYIGGKFSSVGGVDANFIARWNRKQEAWLPLGAGADNWVTDIVVKGKRVYAGGFFAQIGGKQAYHVAVWGGREWEPLGAGLTTEGYEPGTGVRVKGLALRGNSLFVTGYFTHAGEAEANSIAEWRGNEWRSLESGLGGGIGVPFLGDALALAAAPDGVVVAGAFNRAGGGRAFQLAKWSSRSGEWQTLADPGPHQGVYEGLLGTVAVDQGNVYVGGSEMIVGGVVAYGIAKWDGTAWSTLGEGETNGVNGYVNVIAPTGDGGLIVGGLFSRAGEATAINVARWDGAAWSDLGVGVGGSPDSQVFSVAVDGTAVYAAGIFPVAGEIEANNIARWDGTQWSALAGGIPAGPVLAVAAANGVVYAGGQFPEASGVAVSNIARWDGSRWAPLGTAAANGIDGAVLAIALDGDRVYVGGEFATAGGVEASGLALWSNGEWSAVGGGIAPTPDGFGYVTALSVDFRGRLLVGGYFSGVGDIAANNAATWDPASSTWSAFGSGTDGTVWGVAAMDGQVFFAGSFARAGGKPSLRAASWQGVSGRD
jgi:hypothetical protein